MIMSEKHNHGFIDGDGTDSYNSFSAAINSREILTHKDKSNTYSIALNDLKKSAEVGDYEPYNYRDTEHPTTNKETFLHLLKGSLGTGILAMPLAFYHSGYVLGVVATALIGSLCMYCVHMLINCEYELCKRRKVPSMTYPTTAECAFQDGPPIFQRIAPYSQHIINVFLLIYQLGTGTVYTVFIGENIHLVLKENDIHIDARWVMLIFLLPLILINYVKNLKFLTPVSSFANIVTMISFGIIVYFMVQQDIVWENREPFGSYKNYPLFFGTVLFALEAIGVVLARLLRSRVQTTILNLQSPPRWVVKMFQSGCWSGVNSSYRKTVPKKKPFKEKKSSLISIEIILTT
nr:proton-coupled amino acid transporter-like protein CG1139 [Leptinotarsa decemlineata]